jgi:pSer/pThr/pTyr-binding forkhead associated (FHA) protein
MTDQATGAPLPGEPDKAIAAEPNTAAGSQQARAGGDTTMTLSPVALDPTSGQAAPEAPDLDRRLSSADAAAVEALPQGSALLIVHRGPTAGARFLLHSDRTSVGRNPSNDIFLDDATVSRSHAEFVRHHGQLVVRDLGSLNGTYVRGERVLDTVLHSGDEVRIGKFRMVFHPSLARV